MKRTEANCRKRFSDIKSRLKEKITEERRAALRTGGGLPFVQQYTSYEEELKALLPEETIEGVNVQDTDAPRPGTCQESGTQLQQSGQSHQAVEESEHEKLITLEFMDPLEQMWEKQASSTPPRTHPQPQPPAQESGDRMAASLEKFQDTQVAFMETQNMFMRNMYREFRRSNRVTQMG